MENAAANAALPDMTVKAYLESVRDQLAEQIMAHVRTQTKALMEEFEAEKRALLLDAAEAKIAGAGAQKKAKVIVQKKVVKVRLPPWVTSSSTINTRKAHPQS